MCITPARPLVAVLYTATLCRQAYSCIKNCILPHPEECAAQPYAACCIGFRSVLHRHLQRYGNCEAENHRMRGRYLRKKG